MKRYPPYDPPEYLEWQPDAEVMEAYRDRIASGASLRERVAALSVDKVEQLYCGMVRARLYDIALKRWVRTGVLTKAWLGSGEEAVTAGALGALEPEDVVGPMIRNQSAAFEKGIPLADCLKVYLATGDTITQGRDLHIGDLEHNCVSPISHVGDLVPVLAGFALAFQQRGESRVALTWTGEGATRTGAVHEGLSLAAALSLPLITIIQDNHVALGTERSERFERALRATASGHGVIAMECDGNHVLDVYNTIAEAREACLAGRGPVVVYASTFRMGGHATHDEAEARRLFASEEFQRWGQRDPIGCFEEYLKGEARLLGAGGWTRLEEWEERVTQEIEAAAADALESAKRYAPQAETMLGDVFAK